jgi:hypothetical protein
MFQHLSRVCLLGALVTVAMASLSQAAVVKTSCGAPIQSIVVTKKASDPQFESTSTNFVRLPGSALNVVVPAGTMRCVKVRLTPKASCQGNGGNADCFIRAVADGVEMSPGTLGGNDMRDAYQWVSRLGPGTHLVQIQLRRVAENAGAIVRIDDWAMDVEILK